MKRLSGFFALVLALGFAVPVSAQYANEFSPAKLLKQGTTSKPIAGSGTVIVQVQVNADGSHKALKVIKSSNAGDNDAALDIAQNSSYRPAHKGSTPVTAFYDFTLKFNGKSVASSEEGGELSSSAAQVAALIRQQQYAQAKSKAQAALLSNPGDDSLRQMLGIASFDSGDVTGAAAAFDKVNNIGKQFQPIAAASFAAAAVTMADSNASQSLVYAQKAVALNPDTNSKFALGVAQLANNQTAAALATLKAVHDAAMNDPKFNKTSRVNIDARLMSAYLANNDTAGAQAIANEIKQMDPSSTVPGRVMGNSYLKMGVDASNAKNYPEALKYFDQAAANGDPDVQVTANIEAAFLETKTQPPDYKKMQSYADKALAIKPNDAQANFAEGIALAAQAIQAHDDAMKTKALAALNKADALAKQAGNEALALSIETFIKQNMSANGAPPAGGGR